MADKVDVDNAAFLEALERDFQHTISQMNGDQSIERFRRQFQNLYEQLRKSHENERVLLQKLKEMKNQISIGISSFKNSEAQIRNDAQQIKILESELEKVKLAMEQMKVKNEKDKNKIEQNALVMKDLERFINDTKGQQSGKTMEIERLVQETKTLQREKDEIEKETERMGAEQKRLTDELKKIKMNLLNLDTDWKKENTLLNDLEKKISTAKDKAVKQQKDIEDVNGVKEKILQERDAIQRDIDEKTKKNATIVEETVKLEKEIKEKESIKASRTTVKDGYKVKIVGFKTENKISLERHDQFDLDIKVLSTSVNETSLQLAQTRREKEKCITDIQRITNERDEAAKMVAILSNQVSDLQREIEHTDKVANKDQGLVDNLLRDQAHIHKEFKASVRLNQSQQIELQNGHLEVVRLKEEYTQDKDKIGQRVSSINDLQLEKEKYIKEVKQASKKCLHLSEEIKLKDNQISEIQKKTQEVDVRLKHQQQLYEEVRRDKNLYSKNLTEKQDEIAETTLRHKIVIHQTAQLKEELDAKNKALNQQYYKAKDAEKQHQNLKKINEKLKKTVDEKKEEQLRQKNDIGKLQFIMKNSENERKKLRSQYESVVSQRDILGTQLIRRNDELALIYEKLKMQQNTLAKGEAEYRERVNDIDILDHTIKDLTRELTIYKRRAGDLGKYYGEIGNLSKELIEEKLKVKGLSEELENPKNKYRWRNLEGSDCDTNELISKIENLQKRLISKTEEVVAKDLVINSQEQTIRNLEQVMSKQPGLDEAEEISYYQQLIHKKTQQLKALAAELNMLNAQNNELKYDIEKFEVVREQMKKTLFDTMRREQLLIEQDKRDNRDKQMRGTEENIQMI